MTNAKAGRIIWVLFLLLFAISELYSAAATVLDRSPHYPMWEHSLGRALFSLPCLLLVGLVFLFKRRVAVGYSLVVISLCLYMAFMVFESFTYTGHLTSPKFTWLASSVWIGLFFAGFKALLFLKRSDHAVA
jgi:hypothetical protein